MFQAVHLLGNGLWHFIFHWNLDLIGFRPNKLNNFCYFLNHRRLDCIGLVGGSKMLLVWVPLVVFAPAVDQKLPHVFWGHLLSHKQRCSMF